MADTIYESRLREALESDPNVVIVNVEAASFRHFYDYRNGLLDELVDYWVAPKKGLYTMRELQAFMVAHLIPRDMAPTCIYNFRQHNGTLELGRLHFDEWHEGRRRRTSARVYPDVAVAQDILASRLQDKYRISMEELEEYMPHEHASLPKLLGRAIRHLAH